MARARTQIVERSCVGCDFRRYQCGPRDRELASCTPLSWCSGVAPYIRLVGNKDLERTRHFKKRAGSLLRAVALCSR